MALIFPEPGFTGPGIEGGNGSGTTHITSATLVDPLAECWLHIHVTMFCWPRVGLRPGDTLIPLNWK